MKEALESNTEINMSNNGPGPQVGVLKGDLIIKGDVIINKTDTQSLEDKIDILLGRFPAQVNSVSNVEMKYEPTSIIRPVLAVGEKHLLAVRSNGKSICFGVDRNQYNSVSSWRNIVSVGATRNGSVGLRSNGTCIAVGADLIGNGEIFQWSNLTSVSCGAFHVLGLHLDGKVFAFGNNQKHQCEVSSWNNIKAIACGSFHSVGLKNDGTVVAVGDNFHGQCNTESWRDIVQVVAGHTYTVGLTATGEILVTEAFIASSSMNWSDAKSIASGLNHLAVLHKDGTVTNCGMNIHGEDSVERWDNIISIAAGYNATAGLRADGRIFVTNNQYSDYIKFVNIDINNWRLFKNESFVEKQTKYANMLNKIRVLLEKIDAEMPKYIKLTNLFLFHKIQTDVFSGIFKSGLYSYAKDIWEMHTECENMTTLHHLITLHSAAFSDFIEALEKTGPKDATTFKLTAKACVVFITYEKLFKQIKTEVEELLAKEKQSLEGEILY